MQTTPMTSWPQRLRADTADPNEAVDDTVIVASGDARLQTGPWPSERWRGRSPCASAARRVVLSSSSPQLFSFFSARIVLHAEKPSSGIGTHGDFGPTNR